MKLKKMSPSIIGLLQALGVAIYCFLIVGLLRLLENIGAKPPVLMTGIVMLLLLVISVAITGILVFGYPAILALDKNIKRALSILGYTLLYAILIFIIILAIAII